MRLWLLALPACAPGAHYWDGQKNITYGFDEPLPDSDTGGPVGPEGRHCGGRAVDVQLDVLGDGVTADQRESVATCWDVAIAGDTVTVFERLDDPNGPDGSCRVTATIGADERLTPTAGGCTFVRPDGVPTRYDVTGGDGVVNEGGSWIWVHVTSRHLDGDRVVYGTGDFTWEGDITAEPTDAQADLRALPDCPTRDGCYEGTLAGTVDGPAGCETLSTYFAPDQVLRFDISDGGDTLAHDGVEVVGFPHFDTCAVTGTEGGLPQGQWRYTLTPTSGGAAITLALHARIAPSGTPIDCDGTWTGDWAACAE